MYMIVYNLNAFCLNHAQTIDMNLFIIPFQGFLPSVWEMCGQGEQV